MGIFLIVFALVVGLFLFFWGMRQRSKLQILSGKRKMKIGSVRGGFFQFEGRVVPLTTTKTRAGLDCVYYYFHDEQLIRSRNSKGRSTSKWKTVDKVERALEFLLDDGTGAALVRPEGAEFHFQIDSKGRAADPLGSDRRVTETWVAPGDRVNVLAGARPGRGAARSVAATGVGGVRETDGTAPAQPALTSADARLVLSKVGAPLFLITDKPRGELLGHFRFTSGAALTISAFLVIGGVVGAISYNQMR